MRIGIVLSLIGVMALMCGCNTSGEQPQSGGVFYYGGSRHVIKQARMEWQGDVYDNDEQLVELVFSESTLNVTDAGVSGYGAMIKLQLVIDSPSVYGEYVVAKDGGVYSIVPDSSMYVNYLQNRSDTIVSVIRGGDLEVASNNLGMGFAFQFITSNGDSLVGNYSGMPVFNSIIDGDSVGVVQIDTMSYALQQGDLYCWGDLFAEHVYYYEYYLYSTNMRYNDRGAYKDGFYLVLGVQSDNAVRPTDGTYAISTNYVSGTALYGHRDGNVNWGCLWQTFNRGSVSGKANILSDSLRLRYNPDDTYSIEIMLRDQMGNRVDGVYNGGFTIYVDDLSVLK